MSEVYARRCVALFPFLSPNIRGTGHNLAPARTALSLFRPLSLSLYLSLSSSLCLYTSRDNVVKRKNGIENLTSGCAKVLVGRDRPHDARFPPAITRFINETSSRTSIPSSCLTSAKCGARSAAMHVRASYRDNTERLAVPDEAARHENSWHGTWHRDAISGRRHWERSGTDIRIDRHSFRVSEAFASALRDI